jgi:hypothetical protein
MEILKTNNKSLVDKEELASKQEAYYKTEFLEEMADLDMKPERLKIPAGGGTTWEFQNGEITSNFDAQIIYYTRTRNYYPEAFSGGNNPPQCYSPNGEVGIGNPGGACIGCPNTLWGSKDGETGTACTERMSIYFLRAGASFPTYISLAPTSLEIFMNYRRELASQGKILRSVITKFSLLKAESKTGIKYSVVNFTFAGDIPVEDIAATNFMREQLKAQTLARVPAVETVRDISGFVEVDTEEEEDVPV